MSGRDRVVYVKRADGSDSDAAPYREDWRPQRKRGSISACRFVVFYAGRWRRLYSDCEAFGVPHFIHANGRRLLVTGVSP
jgi:hypothetical protein